MGVGRGGGGLAGPPASCWGPTLASGFLGHVTLGRQVQQAGKVGGRVTLESQSSPLMPTL